MWSGAAELADVAPAQKRETQDLDEVAGEDEVVAAGIAIALNPITILPLSSHAHSRSLKSVVGERDARVSQEIQCG